MPTTLPLFRIFARKGAELFLVKSLIAGKALNTKEAISSSFKFTLPSWITNARAFMRMKVDFSNLSYRQLASLVRINHPFFATWGNQSLSNVPEGKYSLARLIFMPLALSASTTNFVSLVSSKKNGTLGDENSPIFFEPDCLFDALVIDIVVFCQILNGSARSVPICNHPSPYSRFC